jgi:hypothetical protein
MSSRNSAITIFATVRRTEWIFVAAAASRCLGPAAVVGKLILVDPGRVPARAQDNDRAQAVADPARARDRDPVVQVAARGQAVVSDRAQGRQAAVAMPLVTFRRARSRTRSLPAATQASPAVAAVVAVREQVVVAVAARVVAAAAVAAAVVVVVAAVAAAVGDQISRSNTTSSFSAISPMASVFIASAIMEVAGPMLA